MPITKAYPSGVRFTASVLLHERPQVPGVLEGTKDRATVRLQSGSEKHHYVSTS
ncbi:MAG: hypothetical protein AAFV45_02755 [Pseudomonadota bacterium]